MAGLIDVAAERDRLDKRLAKARSDLAKCQAKLANAEFVANAPAEVIAKERARVAAFERDIGQIEAQLKLIAALR